MSGPLLIDHLIAMGRSMPGGPVPKSAWATLTHAKYNAQRFVFDEAASEIAGTFAIDCPDLVFGNRQFAVPPYPLTYVEFDAVAFFGDRNTMAMEPFKTDDTLAYLVDGQYVYVLFARKADSDVGTAHWRYKIASPGQYAGPNNVKINLEPHHYAAMRKAHRAYDKSAGISRDGEPEDARINRYLCADVMFGSAVSNISQRGRHHIVAASREVAMQWLDPTMPIARKGVDAKLVSGFMGDVRNYMALMLWLNQQTKVSYVGVPAGAKLVKGKRVPFLSHNIVTISLGKCKTVRRAFQLANERKPPKRHPVRGHYKHRHGRAGCVHDWPLLPDPKGHYICRHCGRMRWYVANFDRGTAERGYATHDYEVTGP